MTTHSFINSLTATGVALGRQYGITVTIGGQEAHTDGQEIVLPGNGTYKDIRKNEILGYLTHEAGHIRFTDFPVFRNLTSPFEFSLLNAIEDVRIEGLMCCEYKGARYLLDECYFANIKEFKLEHLKSKMPLSSALALYVLAYLGVSFGNQPYFSEIRDVLAKRLSQTFPPDVYQGIEEILKAFPTMKSSEDCYTKMVKPIVALLSDAQKNASQDPDETKSDSSSVGQEQKEASGATGQRHEPTEDVVTNQPKKKTGSSKKSASENRLDEKGESQETPSKADSAESPSSALAEMLDKALNAKKVEGFDLSRSYKARMTKSVKTDPNALKTPIRLCTASTKRPRKVKEDPTNGNRLLARARSDSSTTRRALAGLVQTQSRTAVFSARNGQRIMTDKMAQISTFNTRVFKKQIERKGVDTAVHVLLDLSGSMDGIVDTAIRAALALHIGLNALPKVNAGLSVFPTGLRSEILPVVAHGNKTLGKANGLIGGLEAGGGTPLAEAMTQASLLLQPLREKRKILMILTDGWPDNPKPVPTICEHLRKAGISIFAIGIGTDVQHAFPPFVKTSKVERIEDLKDALFTLSRSFVTAES